MHARRLLVCLVIGFSAAAFFGGRGIAAERNQSFCKQAKQRVASNRSLGQAVAAAFGRVNYKGTGDEIDSQCIEPLEVLRPAKMAFVTVLITRDRCFACNWHLSAYMLTRSRGDLRLIAKHEDFAEFGKYAWVDKLTLTRFAGNNSLVATVTEAHTGARIIGRLVSPASAAVLGEALGAEVPALAPTAAIAAVIQDGAGLVLAEGLVLKRSLVMNRQRLELVGFSDTVVDRLKALGLVSEIIAWKLRLFVPLGEEAAKIVEKLFALYPLLRVAPATRVNS